MKTILHRGGQNGGHKGWGAETQRAKNRRLLAAEEVLIEAGLEAAKEWEEDKCRPPLSGVGWWVRFTRVDRQARRIQCRILGD